MSKTLRPPGFMHDPNAALAELAKRYPGAWSSPECHVRRLKRYLRQLRGHVSGAAAIDCRDVAARCRRDARKTEVRIFKRMLRQLAEIFDLLP